MSSIDNPKFETTDIPCPDCEEMLDHYPKQTGPCHSGDFIAHMDETYWCQECERNFEAEEVA